MWSTERSPISRLATFSQPVRRENAAGIRIELPCGGVMQLDLDLILAYCPPRCGASIHLTRSFVLASAGMDVRNRAGLTQAEPARKMGTTQPVVARLERPSMRTLERLAEATGSRLRINV
jgi:hypothetical protein